MGRRTKMQYKVVLKVRHDLDEVVMNIKKLVATADALKDFESSIEEHQEATKIAKKSAYDQAFRHKNEKHTQSITPLYKTPIAVQNLLGVKTSPGLTSKIIKNGKTLKNTTTILKDCYLEWPKHEPSFVIC